MMDKGLNDHPTALLERRAGPHLQSFRKLVEALGQSSVIRSTTISPLLVSSSTAISFCKLEGGSLASLRLYETPC